MSFEYPGNLEKFKIIGLDRKRQIIPNGMILVMVNPSRFSENYAWEYNKDQASGTTGTELKFKKQLPLSFSLPLLFDGTRVMGPTVLPFDADPEITKYLDVDKQIKLFMTATGKYIGEKHGPRPVLLTWGPIAHICYLEKLNLNYTLFKPNGKPLRAEGEAVFTITKESIREIAEQVISSPDLSHYRIVKAGDTLPLLCEEIYGDASRHLEVARYNGIQHIRKLKTGDRLRFPPLDK